MNDHDQMALIALAKEAIESKLLQTPTPLFTQMQNQQKPPFDQEVGCFVTLRLKDGCLRGCIGNLWGKGPLWQEIPNLAREAAFSDPRFHPVKKEELPNIVLEISVLSVLQAIPEWQEIRLGVDGVLLSHGYHRAVFLPQVAPEQGWDIQTMLEQLCLKAGLWASAYTDEACHFEIFQAEVFGEKQDA